MKFKKWLLINEATYKGNLGVVEMIKFYKIASKSDIKEMENAAKRSDWETVKRLIKRVLNVELK